MANWCIEKIFQTFCTLFQCIVLPKGRFFSGGNTSKSKVCNEKKKKKNTAKWFQTSSSKNAIISKLSNLFAILTCLVTIWCFRELNLSIGYVLSLNDRAPYPGHVMFIHPLSFLLDLFDQLMLNFCWQGLEIFWIYIYSSRILVCVLTRQSSS